MRLLDCITWPPTLFKVTALRQGNKVSLWTPFPSKFTHLNSSTWRATFIFRNKILSIKIPLLSRWWRKEDWCRSNKSSGWSAAEGNLLLLCSTFHWCNVERRSDHPSVPHATRERGSNEKRAIYIWTILWKYMRVYCWGGVFTD